MRTAKIFIALLVFSEPHLQLWGWRRRRQGAPGKQTAHPSFTTWPNSAGGWGEGMWCIKDLLVRGKKIESFQSHPPLILHSPSPCPCFTHSPGGTIWSFQELFWSGKHPLSYSTALPKITESRYLLTPVTISNKFSITNFYGDAWIKKNTVWLSAPELFLRGWLLKTKENILFLNWAYLTLKVSER